MLEFNLFLIDYWYFSVPLFLFLILFAYSEMNKGGKKIEPNELTRLVCLLYTSPSPRDGT